MWENTLSHGHRTRSHAASTDSRSVSDRLKALEPDRLEGVTAPSAQRRLVVAHFEAIAEARSRRVTWQQIAKALAEGGIRDEEGGEIGWPSLKNLYHAERYARGERRKRRAKKPQPAAQATSARTAPAAPRALVDPPDDEDDRPREALFRVIPARSDRER